MTEDIREPEATEVQHRPDRRPARLLGALTLLAPLVLYYFTTCPVIYYGDAGELIVAASRWGVAHPPGYPIYIILLGLFLRLPLFWLAHPAQFVQPVAWQANFFSAILGAATVWVVYLILLRLTRHPLLAFSGSLLVAIGRTFWSQTGIAEVYALNALLTSILVLLAIIQNEESPGSIRRAILFRWGSFIWGLSLANHHEMAFFFPVWLTMLVLALQPARENKRSSLPPTRTIIEGVLFLALGLTPYLYLPIAATQNPPLNWGNPSNWHNFWRVLTRAEYRQAKAGITGNLVTSLDILLRFAYWTATQYIPVLLVPAIAGFGILFRKSAHRAALVATAVSLLLINLVFIIYFAGIDRSSLFFLEVYFIPWYISVGALAAIGIAEIPARVRFTSVRLRSVFVTTGIVLLFAGGGLGALQNLESCDMSDNIAGYVYSHDILATLPPPPAKHLLIIGGDEIFLFWYWKWVEGDEKDVAYVGMDALAVVDSWFWDDLRRYRPDLVLPSALPTDTGLSVDQLRVRVLETVLRENARTHRFWMTAWDPAFDPVIHELPLHMVLDGPMLELEWDTESRISDYPRASVPEDVYLFRSLLDVDRTALAPFEKEIYERYAAACYNLAIYFSRENQPAHAAEFAGLCLRFQPGYDPGDRAPSPDELLAINLVKAGDLDLARKVLDDLIKQSPNNSLYHTYLSEVYLAEEDFENALRELEIALQLEPDNVFIRNRYRDLLELRNPPE